MIQHKLLNGFAAGVSGGGVLGVCLLSRATSTLTFVQTYLFELIFDFPQLVRVSFWVNNFMNTREKLIKPYYYFKKNNNTLKFK